MNNIMLKVQPHIAMITDADVFEKANDFACKHLDLFEPSDEPSKEGYITLFHLAGLENAFRSRDNLIYIKQFIENQAKRSKREDVTQCWINLYISLNKLRNDAEKILQKSSEIYSDEDVEEIHLYLAKKFIQHFISHLLFWKPIPSYEQIID